MENQIQLISHKLIIFFLVFQTPNPSSQTTPESIGGSAAIQKKYMDCRGAMLLAMTYTIRLAK